MTGARLAVLAAAVVVLVVVLLAADPAPPSHCTLVGWQEVCR